VQGYLASLFSLSAIMAFLALAYALDSLMCLALWVILWRVRVKASVASALFTAVNTACMFIPLLSLFILSLTYYGGSQAFMEFMISWLRVDVRVVMMFLAAPVPPIVALIIYVEVAKVLNVLEVSKLKREIGIEGFASLNAIRVLGAGYAAGVTVNALAAIGEEIGWRSYLTPALIKHVGLVAAIVIVGIVWGLWHIPGNLAVRPIIERLLPWVTFRLMLLSSVVSSVILSYPLYLLLAVSHSVLPPAAFHGTINALWRIPQFVTKVSDKHRCRDVGKVTLASSIAWGVAVVLTLGLVSLISSILVQART